MPEAKISFKREGGSLLPDGIYRLKIDAVEAKDGPSGFPYLNIRFKPVVNGAVGNQAIWDVISLSPQARFKVDQFLDAVSAPADGDASPRWFEGKMLYATVIAGEYNGNIRNEISTYLPPEVAEQQLAAGGNSALGTGSGEPVQRPAQRGSTPRSQQSARQRAPQVQANPTAEMEEEEFPL